MGHMVCSGRLGQYFRVWIRVVIKVVFFDVIVAVFVVVVGLAHLVFGHFTARGEIGVAQR